MKNIHSLLHLFGERRMVLKNPDIKTLETQYFGDNTEELGEKEKRLTAIHEFISNEKDEYDRIKGAEKLEAILDLKQSDEQTIPFGEAVLNSGTNQLTRQMGLSSQQQVLKQSDLKKSFDEERLTTGNIETFRAEKNYNKISFVKEKDSDLIVIIGSDDKGNKGSLSEFKIQSKFTKEALEKKDLILEEISKGKQEIQKQIAEELVATGELNSTFNTFLDSESKRDAVKNVYNMRIVENPKLNIVGITYAAKSDPKNWPLIRIDTTYQYKPGQKDNFQTRIFRTTPSGEALEILKYPPSSKPLPDREQLYTDIDMALTQTVEAGATKPATKEELEEQKKKLAAKEEKPAEPEKPEITVEPHTGAKKVKEAKTEERDGETILVITTKKNSKFEYKQLRTADGTPYWEYMGKDKDEGGEYYLDDGTRVEADGSKFTKDKEKKSQTASKLIGTETSAITRDKAKEQKKATAKKTGVEFTPTDKVDLAQSQEETEETLRTTNEEVQTAFSESDNEYSLNDKLVRIAPLLKDQKEVQAASFTVEGGKITWDRDSGFKVEDTETDKKKRVEELKSTGLEILSPENVTELGLLEFNGLKNINRDLRDTLENGENAYAILAKIEELGNRLKNALVNSEISKIKFDKFIWTKNEGFGEKLILKETIYDLKKQQLGEGSEEYETFFAKSKTESVKDRSKMWEEKSKDYYSRALEGLTTRTYRVDKSVADLSSDEFAKNWSDFNGRKSAIESIMTTPLFSYEKEKVPVVTCDIIFGANMFNLNSEVNFEDLFEHEKDKFKGTLSSIPKKYFKDSKTFVEAFKKLSTSNDPDDEQIAKTMFEEVITPCLDILKSFETLRYSEKKKKEKVKETDPEQIKINKGLKKLCDFKENGSTGWEGFLNAITGGGKEKELTIQTIDGQKSFMDEGIFLRHNSPKAAYDILRNRKGLYTLDDKGRKVLDEKDVLEEVNRIMKLGYANLALSGKEVAPTPIANFDNLTKEQKLAFQFGFIVDQASRSNLQMKENLEIIAQTTDPVVVEILRVMMNKGIAPKYLTEIRDALVAGVAVGLEIKNGEVSFTGVGGGINIPLSDGLSLTIGVGGSEEGFGVGVGLNIRVYKGDKVMVSVPVGISTEGIGTGAIGTGVVATVKILGRDVSLGAGMGIGFDGAFGVGAGVLIELEDMDKKAKEKVQENLDASAYAKLWEEWKKQPDTSVEAKYETLKRIKPLYDEVNKIQKEYGSSDTDIVFMLELVKEQIVAESFNDLKRFFFTHLGFGVSAGAKGITALPTIGINLGGVEVFIPNRREIAKIMSQLSDRRITNDLEQSLENLEKSLENGTPVKGVFMEKTPDLTYDPTTGRLLSLVESSEINLSNWQTDLEAKNKDLAEAEIKLTGLEGNKVELSVLNADDKDVQIIVDPALSTIAVVKDGSHLCLAGNVNDLIITRERFTTPYQIREDGPAIVDRIVVRQKASVAANRDIDFMLTHSTKTLRQNMGDQEFTVEDGALNAGGDLNILEVAGYMNAKTEDIPEELRPVVEFYKEQTPDLAATLDKGELETMAKNVIARRKAIGTMTKKEYEAETVREDFETNLDKLFDNRKFKKEFEDAENLGGDPTKISSLITEYWDKKLPGLNGKELAYAVTHLENKWYSKLADTKDGREKILKHLESRIKWVHDNIILPEFKKIKEKLGLKSSPEDMAKKVKEDMYGKLLEQLNNKDFDFKSLGVTFIPEHSTFASGSKAKGEKGKEGIYTKNIDYHTLPKAEDIIHDFGFLDGTTTTYNLASSNQVEKDIARAMLEIASPIPESTEAVELLNSPLGRKIATLQVFELLSTAEDSAKITQMYEKLSEGESVLTNFMANGDMSETLNRFNKLLTDIRASQLSGKPFVRKIGQTGLTVKILMSTNIVAGAYAKCANPSHYVEEVGTVQVLKGTQSLYEESTEVTDVDMSKTFAAFTATGAIKSTTVEEPKKEEESGKDTTKTTQAAKVNKNEPAKTPAHGKDVVNYQGEGEGLHKGLTTPPIK